MWLQWIFLKIFRECGSLNKQPKLSNKPSPLLCEQFQILNEVFILVFFISQALTVTAILFFITVVHFIKDSTITFTFVNDEMAV